jgi:hypothetical protein
MTTIPFPAKRCQATFPDLIPGILTHGTVNILAGASGVGKTCLLATVLAKLTHGEPVFGIPTITPPKIGYLCADRGGATAQYWLEKAGSPPVEFYSLVEDFNFVPALLRNKFKLVGVLDKLIDDMNLPPGALLIVDPLTLFVGNPNDYQGVAIACIEIRRAVLRRQLTLVGTAHASKQKADAKAKYERLQDRILGSAAQLGYGDTQMYLASPEETKQKHYTFLWHPHTARAQEFPLGRTEDGMFVDWHQGVDALLEVKVLAAITPDEPGTPLAEIQIAADGASRASVFRLLQQLMAESKITKPGHGRYRRS